MCTDPNMFWSTLELWVKTSSPQQRGTLERFSSCLILVVLTVRGSRSSAPGTIHNLPVGSPLTMPGNNWDEHSVKFGNSYCSMLRLNWRQCILQYRECQAIEGETGDSIVKPPAIDGPSFRIHPRMHFTHTFTPELLTFLSSTEKQQDLISAHK